MCWDDDILMHEDFIQDRFTELYYINKDIYLTRTYQDAYAYESKYYDYLVTKMDEEKALGVILNGFAIKKIDVLE